MAIHPMPEEKKFAPVEMPAANADSASLVEVTLERQETRRTESGARDLSSAAAQAFRDSALAQTVPVPAVRPLKDPIFVEVEQVLEQGLAEYYKAMNPKVQQMFKTRGEELTQTLTEMVQGAHVQLSKVVELIRRWLLLIPGVSKFFLEQEAKIRADRIAMIADLSAERKQVAKR